MFPAVHFFIINLEFSVTGCSGDCWIWKGWYLKFSYKIIFVILFKLTKNFQYEQIANYMYRILHVYTV